MAKKNTTKTFSIKNAILITYISICALMAIMTLGLAFSGTVAVTADPTATSRPTRSPMVLTLQAEDYQPHGEQHQGQGQGQGRNVQGEPEMTATPGA